MKDNTPLDLIKWKSKLHEYGILAMQKSNRINLYHCQPIEVGALPYLSYLNNEDISLHSISKPKWQKLSNEIYSEASQVPVEKVINKLVSEAITSHCSDIHFEPRDRYGISLFRLDGQLIDKYRYSLTTLQMIISRLKLLSNMDLAETRKPQDGRLKMNINKQEIDIRTSCLPVRSGERLVLRLLFTNSFPCISDLNIPPHVLSNLTRLINKPSGLLLVSGPTGCGKTTTLYSIIKSIATKGRNIMTIEDPIEYRLDHISQTQVNHTIGLDFSDGLRSILRQDPDVILVGEIRDSKTAKIAVSAGMTGHLVLSTIHAETIREAINRLVDLGVSPWLLSGSLLSVLEQRLLRKICLTCNYTERWQCSNCNQSGYLGRRGVFNLAQITQSDRQLLWNIEQSNTHEYFSWEKSKFNLQSSITELVEANITNHMEAARIV